MSGEDAVYLATQSAFRETGPDQRDVGAGAAHIAAQPVAQPHITEELGRSDCSGGWPGSSEADRLTPRFFDCRRPAICVKQEEWNSKTVRLELISKCLDTIQSICRKRI
jgi:hypothetical protein